VPPVSLRFSARGISISQFSLSWDVFLPGAIGVTPAVLGPGAYSIAAKTHGRRRISVSKRQIPSIE
jgi:hypothetical protein